MKAIINRVSKNPKFNPGDYVVVKGGTSNEPTVYLVVDKSGTQWREIEIEGECVFLVDINSGEIIWFYASQLTKLKQTGAATFELEE